MLVTPAREEAFRFVARDFADRPAEELVVEALKQLDLPPTKQQPPEKGTAEPGPRSLSPAQLKVYFRGARYAAQAMGLRHAHYAEEIKVDSKAYVAEMDRFTDALDWLRARSGATAHRP